MRRESNVDIIKSIAEIDRLLGEEFTAEPTVSVERGLKLFGKLERSLRPFMVKYAGLVNKAKRTIPVEGVKVTQYLPQAEELSKCREVLLSTAGVAYVRAITLIANNEGHDYEDLVYELYYYIKLTEGKEIFTYFNY